ncbi:hypothetical protein CPB83DRAFT_599750 [Crepidotus variabilis]|uniref:Uncharacterized protein n=1 Tax=Crepidotus variabilis TaxID=179855 RepID=A0A9P6E8X8_9AGAR|nr:hypothetical protein CPB83DRAFT_599750 [Crepidotus variabilis]
MPMSQLSSFAVIFIPQSDSESESDRICAYMIQRREKIVAHCRRLNSSVAAPSTPSKEIFLKSVLFYLRSDITP